MLELADRLGSSTLATGHYARVQEGPLLRTAADISKDQSYVLCALSPDSLAQDALPARRDAQARGARAGRARAGTRRPPAATRRTSASWRGPASARSWSATAACSPRPGPIVDLDGETLGEHGGAHAYTVGQRHGLGLSASEPLYVLATDTGLEHGHRGAAPGAARRDARRARPEAPQRERHAWTA